MKNTIKTQQEFTEEGIAVVKNEVGKSALINFDGKLLTDFLYDYIDEYSHVIKRDNKFGYIDIKTGKEILPCIYDYELICFTDGLAAVTLNGKSGVVDDKNNIVIAFEYDELGLIVYSKCLVASKNGKYGLINRSNEILCSFQFDTIEEIPSTDLFAVSVNDKYGIIDSNGKFVLETKYESVKIFSYSKEYIKLQQNSKWALYSLNKSKFTTDFIYDNLSYSPLDCIVGKVNGEVCITDTSGKKTNFPVFHKNNYMLEALTHLRVKFKDGVAKIITAKGDVYIDKNGRILEGDGNG